MRHANWSVATICVVLAMSTHAFGQEERVNVAEWAAASELLLEAAGMIEKNGWQQGAETAVQEDCVATAIEKAFRANPKYTLVDLNYAKAVLDETIGAESPQLVILKDANSRNEPAVPYWGLAYMDWNDKEGQTAEAVIATMMEAAGRAAAMSKEAASSP